MGRTCESADACSWPCDAFICFDLFLNAKFQSSTPTIYEILLFLTELWTFDLLSVWICALP